MVTKKKTKHQIFYQKKSSTEKKEYNETNNSDNLENDVDDGKIKACLR